VALLAAPAAAQGVSHFDDFESGVGSEWTVWNTVAPPGTPTANQNKLTADTSHNHTPLGVQSARAHASDPAAWNAVYDFGARSGPVRAQVYVFEDFNYTGPQPVTNMLALVGDTGGTMGFGTDYLQLGVVQFLPGGNTKYSTRSRNSGADNSTDTGVSRSAGWTKLEIHADSLGSGGQVRYYINDNLVGTNARSAGADLRWLRLGNNSKSYENFWYDDVTVNVPEPSSIAMLGLGGAALIGVAVRRRRAS
jgi:hypothetical protein